MCVCSHSMLYLDLKFPIKIKNLYEIRNSISIFFFSIHPSKSLMVSVHFIHSIIDYKTKITLDIVNDFICPHLGILCVYYFLLEIKKVLQLQILYS